MKRCMLSDLTPACQKVLIRATAQGINPREVGTHEKHTVSPRTVKALQKRGLLHMRTNQKGRSLWRPTDSGRFIVAEHVPTFLHKHSHRSGQILQEGDGRHSGYTHRTWEAMWNEPEAMTCHSTSKSREAANRLRSAPIVSQVEEEVDRSEASQ